MQHLYAALVIFCIGVTPAHAEENDPGLIEQSGQFFLRGLLQHLPDALKDLEALTGQLEPSLRSFTKEMAPYLRDLLQQVQDWSVYAAPEILPNGDIILRKKHPAQAVVPPLGDIEL